MNPILKILPVLTIVAGTGHAQLAVSADYDFADNTIPAAFGTTAPVIGTTVALAFVMDGGTARLYVNGSEETSHVFSAAGPTPIDTATLEAVVLGGNLFDGAAGAFDGTIDRARWFTFDAGTFAAAGLLGPGDGTIPEPGALTLLGLGGLMVLRRRRA